MLLFVCLVVVLVVHKLAVALEDEIENSQHSLFQVLLSSLNHDEEEN